MVDSREPVTGIRIRLDDGTERSFSGRDAWTLNELVQAGEGGCTPVRNPAPRWSEYVRRLRHNGGLNIQTIEERHGGAFAGGHGRYVLRTPLTVVSTERGKPARRAA